MKLRTGSTIEGKPHYISVADLKQIAPVLDLRDSCSDLLYVVRGPNHVLLCVGFWDYIKMNNCKLIAIGYDVPPA